MKKQYTIGIDIGGTNMKAVLFDGKKVLSDYTLGTPKDSLDHLLIMIKALIEPLQDKAKKDEAKIIGIGLSIAGPVNFLEQKISKAPNIPILDGIKLGEILENKLEIPVKMDNDGNCFILAESNLGAGQKYNNIYGIVLGTSVGSSWYLDNGVYRGAHSGAGEIAHTLIDCSELMTLEKAYQQLTQGSPAELAEKAYRGDSLAIKTFEEVGQLLGIAFANLANTLDPEIIIVGGGVMGSSDLFLPQIKKIMKEHIISNGAKNIKVIKGTLGADAGAIGAALLAF